MQDFRIWVSLDHNIGHCNLHLASITANPTTDSCNLPNLNLRRKTSGHVGKQLNGTRVAAREIGGIEVVKPENAAYAAGAVVERELEKFAGFVIAGCDDTNGFNPRDGHAFAGESGRVGGGGGEGKEIESQELYMSVEEEILHGREKRNGR